MASRLYVFLSIYILIIISSCGPNEPPVPVGRKITNPRSAATSNTGSTGSGGDSTIADTITALQNTPTIGIQLSRDRFYNNQSPNSYSCSGDGKVFHNPLTGRTVTTKPDWLKNIAVELTNSNALYGPSTSTGCAFTGGGAPEAANCATFDDGLPNSGFLNRMTLVGGYGCVNGDTSCTPTATYGLKGDIHTLTATQPTSTALAPATWTTDNVSLPGLGTSTSNAPGLLWAGGDYDHLHNEMYIYGGTYANTTDSTTSFYQNPHILRLHFESNGQLSSTILPQAVSRAPSTIYYGSSLPSVPPEYDAKNPTPTVGGTFTFSSRREPSMETRKNSSSYDILNDGHDYFLSIGGFRLSLATPGAVNQIAIYKPHSYAQDTAPQPVLGGDWQVLTTHSGLSTLQTVRSIAYNSTSTTSSATISTPTFDGLGFHRTVYDSKYNQFIIFGGLQGIASAPTLTNKTVWIFEPPANNRRPNAACFFDTGVTTLASATIHATLGFPYLSSPSPEGLNITSPRALRPFFANNYIFPPGGCLKKISFDSASIAPDARFEQSMAIDARHHGVLVFGGCTAAPTSINATAGSTSFGNPLGNCNTPTALKNDTWIYLPPTAVEYASSDTVTNYQPNVFSLDYWLSGRPRFLDNDPLLGAITKPTQREVEGRWLYLNPATAPTKRASAAISYDKAHHKFYLFGGYGCSDTGCADGVHALNDLWEYTPPEYTDSSVCSESSQTCSSQGTWRQIRPDRYQNGSDGPTQRYGSILAFNEPAPTSSGDQFYQVSDGACYGQGPINTGDSSVSKKFVGAIYIDLDRNHFTANENLLLNLRFLPFDKNTRPHGYYDNDTPQIQNDDHDRSNEQDRALIRVQLIRNPLRYAEQIQSTNQPRYRHFIGGSSMIADTFTYLAGASGQVTEKQILIPLSHDSSIDLIKIERVQGTAKFFELNLSKF